MLVPAGLVKNFSKITKVYDHCIHRHKRLVSLKKSLVLESRVFSPLHTHNRSLQAMRLVSKDSHLIFFLRKHLKTFLVQNSVLELKIVIVHNCICFISKKFQSKPLIFSKAKISDTCKDQQSIISSRLRKSKKSQRKALY